MNLNKLFIILLSLILSSVASYTEVNAKNNFYSRGDTEFEEVEEKEIELDEDEQSFFDELEKETGIVKSAKPQKNNSIKTVEKTPPIEQVDNTQEIDHPKDAFKEFGTNTQGNTAYENTAPSLNVKNVSSDELRKLFNQFEDAMDEGNVERGMQLIIEEGLDINYVDQYMMTPLLEAVRNRVSKMARFLIENGADVNAKNEDGNTPLHFAAGVLPEITRLLIENGADVNAKGDYKTTPLMEAVERENLEDIKFLLNAGADLEAKDNIGTTPLINASMYGSPEVIKLLLDAGADVHAVDKYGNSPIEILQRYGLY